MALTPWKLSHGTYTMEVTSWNLHHGSYLMELTLTHSPWKLPMERTWNLHGSYLMELTPWTYTMLLIMEEHYTMEVMELTPHGTYTMEVTWNYTMEVT